MTRVFDVTGMHCGGCLSRVQQAATKLALGTTVTLDPPRMTLPEGAAIDAAAINAALTPLGDYRVKAAAAS